MKKIAKHKKIVAAFDDELEMQRSHVFLPDQIQDVRAAVRNVCRSFNAYITCPEHAPSVVSHDPKFVERSPGFKQILEGVYANRRGVVSFALRVLLRDEYYANVPIKLGIEHRDQVGYGPSRTLVYMWSDEWAENKSLLLRTDLDLDNEHDTDLNGFYDVLAEAIRTSAVTLVNEAVLKAPA